METGTIAKITEFLSGKGFQNYKVNQAVICCNRVTPLRRSDGSMEYIEYQVRIHVEPSNAPVNMRKLVCCILTGPRYSEARGTHYMSKNSKLGEWTTEKGTLQGLSRILGG